jgi:dienelactone hydrolase
MPRCFLALIGALWSTTLAGAPVGKVVEYRVGDATLEGYLAYDGVPGRRPGILIIPDGGGENARRKAEQWATHGYVAFAVPPVGRGNQRDGNPKASRPALEAGLAVLARQTQVDDHWLAAVGYGAGGPAALELAYTGADLDGVVCIHAEPDAPTVAEARKIRGKVLVLLGDRAPPAAAREFEEALRKAGVEVRILLPAEGPAGPERAAQIDARAFVAARSFCADLFPKKRSANRPPAGAGPAGVPAKVMTVLKHVDDQGEAPKGYEGGRNFGNFEGHLPKRDADGRSVKYREWDVNPLEAGVNRGAERLVTGSDGSAYYSDDHYRTFKKIR